MRKAHKQTFELDVENPITEDSAKITVEVEEIDEGIGPYEYWGARGVHHDYRLYWEVIDTSDSYFLSDDFYNNKKLNDYIQKEVEELYSAYNEADDGY